MSFSKTTKIIIATIIVISGFALFYFFQNKSDEKNMFSLGEFNLPESFFVDDETEIKFEWTDDNKGEDLIIQSDKKSYFGVNESIVYFSMTNLNQQNQEVNLRFLFKDEGAGLSNIEKINPNKSISALTSTDKPTLKFKSIKGFTSSDKYYLDSIKSGETNYYQGTIKYPPNSKGEFYIESKGNNGAYGLLDPFYDSSGLVGYWSFDGSDIDWGTNIATDGSDSGNNGTMTSMSTASSPIVGVKGQALNFDGVDDSISIGIGTDYFPMDTFSMCSWVKSPGLADGMTLNGILSITYGLSISLDNSGRFLSRMDNGVTAINVSAGDNLADNEWHWVCLTFDGINRHMFVDGVNKLSTPTTWLGTTRWPTNAGNIGYENNNKTICKFNGSIDEVLVYNRALSVDEISALYKLGTRKAQVKTTGSNKMKINTSTVNRLTDGLVGHWTFDGADMDWSTNTVIDRSGQGNNGTITNMSTTASPSIGKFGQALYFNELDDVVNLGKKSILMDPNSFGGVMGASTISLWVKKTDPVGVTRYNVMTHHLGGIDYFSAGISTSGQLRTMVKQEDGTNYWPLSTSEVPSGVWTHVVFIIEGGVGYKFYINGSLDRDFPYPAIRLYDHSAGTDNAYLGSNIGSTTFLEGSIDDVRVYNRALSSTEISELYDMGAKKIKIR